MFDSASAMGFQNVRGSDLDSIACLRLSIFSVGLHNKFPPHFYNPSNLFNTHLSHGEKQAARPASKPVELRRRRPKRAVKAEPGVGPPPKAAAVQLGEFAKEHMSTDEARRFLELVAAHCDVPLRSDRNHWEASLRVSHFASEHLGEDRTLLFLRELEDRRLKGEPLIQR
jgi:hypothetical protein